MGTVLHNSLVEGILPLVDRIEASQSAAASAHAPLIAVIHRSHLLLRSSVAGKIVRSIPLDTQIFTACKRPKWYHCIGDDDLHPQSQDKQSGTSRLLLADDDTIHLYDASDPEWHVAINGVSNNSGKIAGVDFGYTANEVVVFSDYGLKATIWSLLSSRGVEIRDPKFSSHGYCFRPRTGHLAIITRETTKDIVMVLAPGTRELENSFALATVDAQGLKWSPDGRWLVTWDAASAGYNVLIYTSDGHLFRTYSGGQDPDRPGLGVKTVIWEPSHRFLVVACYNHQITLLSSTTFKPVAILQHHNIINSSTAIIWQEQIDASNGRSYILSPKPACPPGQASPSKESAFPKVISHLAVNGEGTFLASCCEQTPTTVWVWSLDSVAPLVTLIHHSAVKNIQWNPQDPCFLLIHCSIEEPVVHLWHSTWEAPCALSFPLSKLGPKTEASWVNSSDPENPGIMLANTHNFAVQRLQGDDVDETTEGPSKLSFAGLGPEDMFDEGNSMDLSPIKLSHENYEAGFGMGGAGFDDDVDDTFDYRRHLAIAG
ncbi:hypothetical protein MMC30_006347 [Trapelia coarctata]|nr:hypothetical protein [Trapelia coarctata]